MATSVRVDGDPPAAYRYTESRMSQICHLYAHRHRQRHRRFYPNYDDRLKEPLVLPPATPTFGQRVYRHRRGHGHQYPASQPAGSIDGICYLIDNPEATLEELLEHIKGPDFPTGGVIMGRSGHPRRLCHRARAHRDHPAGQKPRSKSTKRPVAHCGSRAPYMVNKARLIENIADLHKEKRVDSISRPAG